MRGFALAALLASACGGGTAAPEKPKQESVDERKAEKDAKGLVKEIYQSVGHSNTDGLMALLADPLVVFGPRKADAHATRSDALVTLREALDKQKDGKPTVQSGSLAVVASPGGLSAWAVDTMEVAGQPMAMTVVLSNDDDFWVVVAADVAETPSMKSVRSKLKEDAVVPTGMQGIAQVPDAAEAAVDRFKRGLANPAVWAEDLAKRGDAIVIGPSAGDVTRGKKPIASLWKKREKVNTRHASAGEVTAGTTPDGQLAWVSAPVVRFADDDDPLPLRLFSVFEKSKDGWSMISLQESLALDEPGQGASFKKISAPAVKEEPPPPPKEEKPEKKKKKKKKKSSDD
jgi:ketosteroid isomerase-like protein